MGDYDNPHRPYTPDWGERERQIRENQERDRIYKEFNDRAIADIYGPKDPGTSGERRSGGGSGEPITAEEAILFITGGGLLPLAAYVAAGNLNLAPWWTFVVGAVAIIGAAVRWESVNRFLIRTSIFAFAWMIVAAFAHVASLHERVLLGVVLSLSFLYSALCAAVPALRITEGIFYKFDKLAIIGFVLLSLAIFVCSVLTTFMGMDLQSLANSLVWYWNLFFGSFVELFQRIWSNIEDVRN